MPVPEGSSMFMLYLMQAPRLHLNPNPAYLLQVLQLRLLIHTLQPRHPDSYTGS